MTFTSQDLEDLLYERSQMFSQRPWYNSMWLKDRNVDLSVHAFLTRTTQTIRAAKKYTNILEWAPRNDIEAAYAIVCCASHGEKGGPMDPVHKEEGLHAARALYKSRGLDGFALATTSYRDSTTKQIRQQLPRIIEVLSYWTKTTQKEWNTHIKTALTLNDIMSSDLKNRIVLARQLEYPPLFRSARTTPNDSINITLPHHYLEI